MLPSLKQEGESSRFAQNRWSKLQNTRGEPCQSVKQQPNHFVSQIPASLAAPASPQHENKPFWPFSSYTYERCGNQTRRTQNGAAVGHLPCGFCRGKERLKLFPSDRLCHMPGIPSPCPQLSENQNAGFCCMTINGELHRPRKDYLFIRSFLSGYKAKFCPSPGTGGES